MAFKFVPQLESLVENLGVPGIAAIVLLPVIVPVATSVAKPLAKAAIKGGLSLYEQSKEMIDELGETFEDIVAEAKAELAQENTKVAEPREIQVEGN